MTDFSYYSPEQAGLSVVTEIDLGSSYDFDIFVVYIDSYGLLYWGHDQGCSCPSPFEDVHTLEELERGNKIQALAALTNWLEVSYNIGAENNSQVVSAREKLWSL